MNVIRFPTRDRHKERVIEKAIEVLKHFDKMDWKERAQLANYLAHHDTEEEHW
jgi:hypothetical protein